MDVSFRITTQDDAILLLEWLNDAEILRYFPMESKLEVEDAVRIWLSYQAQNASYAAVVDGKVVGMAVLYLQTFQKLKHQSLFAIILSKEARGKGIGTKLIEHLEKEAKGRHKLEKLHLEVYEGNPAMRLYTRLGFKEYGRHPHFLKDRGEYITKILMEKDIQ